jgi:hypothetical protein
LKIFKSLNSKENTELNLLLFLNNGLSETLIFKIKNLPMTTILIKKK